MIASAPGKLILTGEYAVLDGAPALVVAIDRRVVAREQAQPSDFSGSPFLAAVVRELERRRGGESDAARRARRIVVDSQAFFHNAQKLGLGSSAAVTVAATALALGGGVETVVRDEVLAIAIAAHAEAQGAKGARGSGADVAAAVHGGTIAYTAVAGGPPRVQTRRWPDSVLLVPFFTGMSADTATLVERVTAARAANPAGVEAALAAVAHASRAAASALGAPADLAVAGVIAAFQLAAEATDRLASASAVALVPDCVRAARRALESLGGTAKTTGAGGGDIGIGVVPATIDVTKVASALVEAGCQPLRLRVDDRGVDLRPDAQ